MMNFYKNRKAIALAFVLLLVATVAFGTITNTTLPPQQYDGNDLTTDFPITFDYNAESDLSVSLKVNATGAVTDWTQDALGDEGYTIVSGEVIANTAPATGTTLTIDCETEITQTVDLKNNRKTAAEIYETAYDKVTLIGRDNAAKIERALVAPASGDPDVSYTMPDYEASSYIQWHPTSKELRNATLTATGTATTGTDVGDLVELIDDGGGDGVFPLALFGLDEDDFASNSAIRAPSQQSVTPYVSRYFDLVERKSTFIYKDTDEIYLNAGQYFHYGTTEQLLKWSSQLTYAFASLAVSDWSYLYLDDSAIVTADTNIITASELTDSTTPPTWSDSKQGWYNGEDRCIFAVLTNGSSEILEFWYSNGLVLYGAPIRDLTAVDIDTAWVDVPLTLPALGDSLKGLVIFRGNENGGGDAVYWRKNGSSADGHTIFFIQVDVADPVNTIDVIVDSANTIEVKMATTGASTLTADTAGWYLPIGM
jgi:hypothetical protein